MIMRIKKIAEVILFILSLIFFWPNGYAEEASLKPKIDTTGSFVNYMVKAYHFNREALQQLLSKARYDPEVIFKVTNPYEKKAWSIYQAHFLTNERIKAGARYWKAHETALKHAYERYGIAPEVIVAIIGIETFYGQQIGNYSALDTLSTLALHNRFRKQFFNQELIQFLLLTKEQQLSPFNVKSSYAGAIGIPQFMPSTYRHYAVSFSPTSTPDLTAHHEDAIASIGNYLHLSGWKKNRPVTVAVTSRIPLNTQLISSSAIPNATVKQLKAQGINAPAFIPDLQKASIIALGETSPQIWLAFENFRAIMRYNPRIHYAMIVHQLSQAIKKEVYTH